MLEPRDTAKWVGVALAALTLLITFYKGAMWAGDLEAQVDANTQELFRRSPYVDELLTLKARVAEVKEEIERRRLPTNRIEGIEEDLARLAFRIAQLEEDLERLEARADSLHFKGHEREEDLAVPPEDRVVP